MDLRNFTGTLARGEAFLRAKAALVDTTGLVVHVKFTKARGRDVNGYYRWEDRRMVLAVKQRLRYPRAAAYGVGTTPRDARRLGGLPYRLVWHEESFASADDLLVFVAGHEFWHFLCHSGQRKRDHETRANCHGFAWLREFRTWQGAGAPVEEIPSLPPRPDRTPTPLAEASPPAPGAQIRPSAGALLAAAPTTPAAPRTRAPGRAVASPDAPRAAARGGLLEAARQLLLFR